MVLPVMLALLPVGGSTDGPASSAESIIKALAARGLVSIPLAVSADEVTGTIRDPETGAQGIWLAEQGRGDADLFVRLQFARALDREALRSRLSSAQRRALRNARIGLDGNVVIFAGRSTASTRHEWEAAVALAGVVKRAAKTPTVPIPTDGESKRPEIPMSLRVTSLSEADLTAIAAQRGWPLIGIGGGGGMSPIPRSPAPRVSIYALETLRDETISGHETRVLRVDPQFYFRNVVTDSRRSAIARELAGWQLDWENVSPSGYELNLSPGYRVGEIVDRLERAARQAVRFREGSGKAFLQRFD